MSDQTRAAADPRNWAVHSARTWRDEAACHPDRRPEGTTRAEWTELFFPGRGNATRPALEVCARCPVRAECAADAIGEREGIWGGMNGRQRRRTGAPGVAGYPPEVRAKALALTDAGHSGVDIAERLGVHPRTVYAWRRARTEVEVSA